MSKAIFFDIDGTLVDFKGHMSAATLRSLERLKKSSHKIVLCSGRPQCEIYPYMIHMGFDGIISSSGAHVVCDGETVYASTVPVDVLDKAIDVMEEAGAQYEVQCHEFIGATAEYIDMILSKYPSVGAKEGNPLMGVEGCFRPHKSVRGLTCVEKMIYHDSRLSHEEIVARLGDLFDVTASSFQQSVELGAGELTLKGINKSLGMIKFMEAMGIAREDCIAFGDSYNDCDMLAFAGTGVAMENACEELKNLADMITGPVDGSGIEVALIRLGLI